MNVLRSFAALALMLCVSASMAAGPADMLKQVESSMLVTGWIHVEPDGSVGSYVLDLPEQLPLVVPRMLDKAVPTWKFEPVLIDGKAVRARTRMSVRFVAKRTDDGKAFNVRIASGSFGIPGAAGTFRSKDLRLPAYPLMAARSGVTGTVYVLARVGRDGRVEEAIAEQVNITVLVNEDSQARWHRILAKAALAAADDWTFEPPTEGDEVDDPFWLVRVPIAFLMANQQGPKYGEWENYLPGPRQSAPWLGAIDTSLGADAVADGTIQPLGTGPKLLTPIGG